MKKNLLTTLIDTQTSLKVKLDEVFLKENEPIYERDRALIALNYKPSKATTIQIGYICQSDYKIYDETGRNFFQIGYFIEISPKKSRITSIDCDIKDN